MSSATSADTIPPIDAVITWVDGNDPALMKKMEPFLEGGRREKISGASHARFGSADEIRLCVMSILRFAPFIRNIFIITDGQDPGLHEEIREHYPGREDSVRIVDHKEIFSGFEQYLPVFSSRSIETMIWRIEGLSDCFVYFNDDTFLVRSVRPSDWFREGRPVLRGKWLALPLIRIIGGCIRRTGLKLKLYDKDYVPRASYHMGQWRSAALLGFRFRYFYFRHTPHPVCRKKAEDFYKSNSNLLVSNISHRFRHPDQYNPISLFYHLELLSGNRNIATHDLTYVQPYKKTVRYIDKKIIQCVNKHNIKYICVQNLNLCGSDIAKKVSDWMDTIIKNEPLPGDHQLYNELPIDAVISWVDGNDPSMRKKRESYIDAAGHNSNAGALPTFYASNNEIRYCVLSILTFARFVRNIYIITDHQDPNLYKEINARFPERSASLKIIDHSEIFRDYEDCLPTFNSTTILTLIWRIKGLSDNFIYFNDDTFLLRNTTPEDWFIDGRPVLRGKWLLPPYMKIAGNRLKIIYNRYLLKNKTYSPKLSFYIRQWKTALMTGMRWRYYFHCHTPHPFNRKLLENYFAVNPDQLTNNIKYRFRNPEQFLLSSLAYHLEIIKGNRHFRPLDLCYLHPVYSRTKLERRIRNCIKNPAVKFLCVQSLDQFGKEVEDKIFGLMDDILKPDELK